MASTLFWNLVAKSYVAAPVPDEAVYQRKLAQTRERLTPNATVLEIGCGSGNTALAHAPYVAHITAVDFAEKMLAHGRANAKAKGISNVDFQRKSLADMADGSPYDAVLMLSVLHLIPDWKDAVARAAALTKSGGIFVSSTLCVSDQSGLMRLLPSVLRVMPLLPNVTAFSRAQLVAEIKKHGFIIEEEWQARPKDAVFVIARKVDNGTP